MPPTPSTDSPPRRPHWPAAARVLATAALLGTLALATHALWREHPSADLQARSCPAALYQAPALEAAHDAPAPSELDGLRIAASLGNEDASAALSGALLDRYDQLADTGALFEAMHWLERDLDSPHFQAFALVERVVHGACVREPALKWRELCNLGE